MLLILGDRVLLLVVQLVVARSLDNLPIAGRMNVLARSVEHHLTHELTNPTVLIPVSVHKNIFAVWFQKGTNMENVAIQNLHAGFCQK